MINAYGLQECYDFSDPLPDKKSGFRGVWYQAERSKSGRAQCRCCRQKIANAVLRIGVNQDCSYEQRGSNCGWFHAACFFKVTKEGKEYWARKVTSTDQIQGYDSLSQAHKDEINKQVGGGGAKTTTTTTSTAQAPKNSKNVLFYYDAAEGGFVAVGNTRPVKDYMREYGGTWNYAKKFWLFQDASELGGLVPNPQKYSHWKKEMSVEAIEDAAEGEDESEEEDSDFSEGSSDDSDEEMEDSEDEEAPVFYQAPKKVVPQTKASSSFFSTPTPTPTPTPSFPQIKKKPPPANFSLAKTTNFDFTAPPSPSLPTFVAYPSVKMTQSGGGGMGGGGMEVCYDVLPKAKSGGAFSGKTFYFLPGCVFSTPTAHLKKKVRDNGGVIIYNPDQANSIVCDSERMTAAQGMGKQIVQENYFWSY